MFEATKSKILFLSIITIFIKTKRNETKLYKLTKLLVNFDNRYKLQIS